MATEPALVISRADFDRLLQYDTSLPTGPKPGFRWRRRQSDREGRTVAWWMGEAFELPEAERVDRWGHELVGIRWRRLHVLEERREAG